MMISIIVCSVDPFMRNRLKENIKETIGSSFEFLYTDNIIDKRGICNVYNALANKAKGSYLCFVHEDVEFKSHKWGDQLISKAMDRSVGVIGFCGSGTMSGFPYWNDRLTYHSYLIQGDKNGSIHNDDTINVVKSNFERVAVLDGMFLFCRKDVWAQHPFDDTTFVGFHLYDIDFTFSVCQTFNNYVCQNVVIAHYSLGCPDKDYFENMIKFYNKWKAILPYSTNPSLFSDRKKMFYYYWIKDTIVYMADQLHFSNKYIMSYLKKIDGVKTLTNYLTAKRYILKSKIRKLNR